MATKRAAWISSFKTTRVPRSRVVGAAATRIANDLRRRIAGLRISHRASATAQHVTVTVGVAAVEPAETTHSPAGALQLADQLLYEGKKQGRNRVVGEEIAETHIRTGVFKSG